MPDTHCAPLWKLFLIFQSYKLYKLPLQCVLTSISTSPLAANATTTIEPAHNAAVLAAQLAQASPQQIVEAAVRLFGRHLAVISSFGTESAVLLKFVADVDRSLPVLFLDTL
jgi:hypothetical protein